MFISLLFGIMISLAIFKKLFKVLVILIIFASAYFIYIDKRPSSIPIEMVKDRIEYTIDKAKEMDKKTLEKNIEKTVKNIEDKIKKKKEF